MQFPLFTFTLFPSLIAVSTDSTLPTAIGQSTSYVDGNSTLFDAPNSSEVSIQSTIVYTENCSWAYEDGLIATPNQICGMTTTSVSSTSWYTGVDICLSSGYPSIVNYQTIVCPNGRPIRLVKTSTGLQCTGTDSSSGAFYWLGTVHSGSSPFSSAADGWFRNNPLEMIGYCPSRVACGLGAVTYRQCYTPENTITSCYSILGKYIHDQTILFDHSVQLATGCSTGNETQCMADGSQSSYFLGSVCCSGNGTYSTNTGTCQCNGGTKSDNNGHNCAVAIQSIGSAAQHIYDVDLLSFLCILISSVIMTTLI